jgi:hypothetical protein
VSLKASKTQYRSYFKRSIAFVFRAYRTPLDARRLAKIRFKRECLNSRRSGSTRPGVTAISTRAPTVRCRERIINKKDGEWGTGNEGEGGREAEDEEGEDENAVAWMIAGE